MRISSKTGLSSCAPKKIARRSRHQQAENQIDFKADSRPASFVIKPLAGIYNPYRYGCSLLCNHPTDEEAKELLRRAKDAWANDGKRAIIFENEIGALRDSLEQLQVYSKPKHNAFDTVETVPEKHYRRYTKKDSRPQTPALSLSSSAAAIRNGRRCVTPDPTPISTVKGKTLLILDLRKSHSQELISSNDLDPPLILIQRVPTKRSSLTDLEDSERSKFTILQQVHTKIHQSTDARLNASSVENRREDGDEIEVFKRRGKRRCKKRNGSTALPVQNSIDPETQVGKVLESRNASARHSSTSGGKTRSFSLKKSGENANESSAFRHDSFLDTNMIKLLRRELTEEIYDYEFDWKRRIALGEALKTLSHESMTCDDLEKLQSDLDVPPPNTDLWISIPRGFSRSNARFELPPFSTMLEKMSPMNYIRQHVDVKNRRKIMYNSIFNKFRSTQTNNRMISGNDIINGLHILMGQNRPIEPLKSFEKIVQWNHNEMYDFKTFCCICATCERLLAREFTKSLPDKKQDPCHELEIADFEALNRKLISVKCIDENLVELLDKIKNL